MYGPENQLIRKHPKVRWLFLFNPHLSFSQTHKVGNVGIICSFPLYLHKLMLVNVKLEIKRYMRITFKGYLLYWTGWFLMAELKQSCQHWHSCIAGSLWKTLFDRMIVHLIQSSFPFSCCPIWRTFQSKSHSLPLNFLCSVFINCPSYWWWLSYPEWQISILLPIWCMKKYRPIAFCNNTGNSKWSVRHFIMYIFRILLPLRCIKT